MIQFASAPAVVEPYALSPAEFQELTTFGLRYFAHMIPDLDGPGHVRNYSVPPKGVGSATRT
jgi:hexosaminidase